MDRHSWPVARTIGDPYVSHLPLKAEVPTVCRVDQEGGDRLLEVPA